MITADQIILHFVGDYLIQSNWMASEKTKKYLPCLIHAITYALGFLFLTTSWKALLLIGGSHFIFDHFRVAKYMCFAKNFIAPPSSWKNNVWSECNRTGYPNAMPPHMSDWLMIISDNILHIILNGLALYFL